MIQKKQASEAEIIRILVEDLAEYPESKSVKFHYGMLEEKREKVSELDNTFKGLLNEERELAHSTAVDEERLLVKNRIRQLLGWGLEDE